MLSALPYKMKLLAFFLILSCSPVFSQTPQGYFSDHEMDLSIPLTREWSMGTGVGYRSMLQERIDGKKISGSGHEHFEINHFTNYKATGSLVFSLGLRYRFKELFDAAETNEFRIIEQLDIVPVNSSLPLSHRFRLEQRIMEHVVHRLRYELEFSQPMSRNFSLKTGTEALYAVSANLRPEAEQRFTLGVENSSFKDLELGLALEYRMENYVLDLAHEFFLITKINFTIN